MIDYYYTYVGEFHLDVDIQFADAVEPSLLRDTLFAVNRDEVPIERSGSYARRDGAPSYISEPSNVKVEINEGPEVLVRGRYEGTYRSVRSIRTFKFLSKLKPVASLKEMAKVA